MEQIDTLKSHNIFNEFGALSQIVLENVFGGEEGDWYWITYHLSRGFHPTPATWTNPTAGELMSA